ncbi:unnamed protein product [Chrysoparadoxa australica]
MLKAWEEQLKEKDRLTAAEVVERGEWDDASEETDRLEALEDEAASALEQERGMGVVLPAPFRHDRPAPPQPLLLVVGTDLPVALSRQLWQELQGLFPEHFIKLPPIRVCHSDSKLESMGKVLQEAYQSGKSCWLDVDPALSLWEKGKLMRSLSKICYSMTPSVPRVALILGHWGNKSGAATNRAGASAGERSSSLLCKQMMEKSAVALYDLLTKHCCNPLNEVGPLQEDEPLAYALAAAQMLTSGKKGELDHLDSLAQVARAKLGSMEVRELVSCLRGLDPAAIDLTVIPSLKLLCEKWEPDSASTAQSCFINWCWLMSRATVMLAEEGANSGDQVSDAYRAKERAVLERLEDLLLEESIHVVEDDWNREGLDAPHLANSTCCVASAIPSFVASLTLKAYQVYSGMLGSSQVQVTGAEADLASQAHCESDDQPEVMCGSCSRSEVELEAEKKAEGDGSKGAHVSEGQVSAAAPGTGSRNGSGSAPAEVQDENCGEAIHGDGAETPASSLSVAEGEYPWNASLHRLCGRLYLKVTKRSTVQLEEASKQWSRANASLEKLSLADDASCYINACVDRPSEEEPASASANVGLGSIDVGPDDGAEDFEGDADGPAQDEGAEEGVKEEETEDVATVDEVEHSATGSAGEQSVASSKSKCSKGSKSSKSSRSAKISKRTKASKSTKESKDNKRMRGSLWSRKAKDVASSAAGSEDVQKEEGTVSDAGTFAGEDDSDGSISVSNGTASSIVDAGQGASVLGGASRAEGGGISAWPLRYPHEDPFAESVLAHVPEEHAHIMLAPNWMDRYFLTSGPQHLEDLTAVYRALVALAAVQVDKGALPRLTWEHRRNLVLESACCVQGKFLPVSIYESERGHLCCEAGGPGEVLASLQLGKEEVQQMLPVDHPMRALAALQKDEMTEIARMVADKLHLVPKSSGGYGLILRKHGTGQLSYSQAVTLPGASGTDPDPEQQLEQSRLLVQLWELPHRGTLGELDVRVYDPATSERVVEKVPTQLATELLKRRLISVDFTEDALAHHGFWGHFMLWRLGLEGGEVGDETRVSIDDRRPVAVVEHVPVGLRGASAEQREEAALADPLAEEKKGMGSAATQAGGGDCSSAVLAAAVHVAPPEADSTADGCVCAAPEVDVADSDAAVVVVPPTDAAYAVAGALGGENSTRSINAKAGAEADPEAVAEADVEADAEADAKVDAEADAGAGARVHTDANVDASAKLDVDADTDVGSGADTDGLSNGQPGGPAAQGPAAAATMAPDSDSECLRTEGEENLIPPVASETGDDAKTQQVQQPTCCECTLFLLECDDESELPMEAILVYGDAGIFRFRIGREHSLVRKLLTAEALGCEVALREKSVLEDLGAHFTIDLQRGLATLSKEGPPPSLPVTEPLLEPALEQAADSQATELKQEPVLEPQEHPVPKQLARGAEPLTASCSFLQRQLEHDGTRGTRWQRSPSPSRGFFLSPPRNARPTGKNKASSSPSGPREVKSLPTEASGMNERVLVRERVALAHPGGQREGAPSQVAGGSGSVGAASAEGGSLEGSKSKASKSSKRGKSGKSSKGSKGSKGSGSSESSKGWGSSVATGHTKGTNGTAEASEGTASGDRSTQGGPATASIACQVQGSFAADGTVEAEHVMADEGEHVMAAVVTIKERYTDGIGICQRTFHLSVLDEATRPPVEMELELGSLPHLTARSSHVEMREQLSRLARERLRLVGEVEESAWRCEVDGLDEDGGELVEDSAESIEEANEVVGLAEVPVLAEEGLAYKGWLSVCGLWVHVRCYEVVERPAEGGEGGVRGLCFTVTEPRPPGARQYVTASLQQLKGVGARWGLGAARDAATAKRLSQLLRMTYKPDGGIGALFIAGVTSPGKQ